MKSTYGNQQTFYQIYICEILFLIVFCDSKLTFFLFLVSLLQYQLSHLVSDFCICINKLWNNNFAGDLFSLEWKISTFGIHQNLLGGDDVLVPPSLFLLLWTWCSGGLSQHSVEAAETEVAQAPERLWDSILYIIVCKEA